MRLCVTWNRRCLPLDTLRCSELTMSLSGQFGGPCECRATFAYFVPVAGLPEEPDSSRAQRSDAQLAPDDGRHLSAEDKAGS
jgi:hypothetical protein